MMIIEVTGPPGSGKSTLMGVAAKQHDKEIHNVPTMTRHHIDVLINETAEMVYSTQRIIFFDEVDRFRHIDGKSFRDYITERYSELPVRIVLIGE